MTAKKPRSVVSASMRANSMKAHYPDRERPPTNPIQQPLRPSTALASINDYDQEIGRPETWPQAKAREDVVGELIANEIKREEAAIRRGKLFTLEQVVERDRAKNDLFFAQLARVAELVNSLVDPAARDDARHRVQEFIADARRQLAEAITARNQ